MSLDSRTLRKDDSPKTRVLALNPNCVCVRLDRSIYAIKDGEKYVCQARNAYQAWLEAEFVLSTNT